MLSKLKDVLQHQATVESLIQWVDATFEQQVIKVERELLPDVNYADYYNIINCNLSVLSDMMQPYHTAGEMKSAAEEMKSAAREMNSAAGHSKFLKQRTQDFLLTWSRFGSRLISELGGSSGGSRALTSMNLLLLLLESYVMVIIAVQTENHHQQSLRRSLAPYLSENRSSSGSSTSSSTCYSKYEY